ncbi:ATP synthase F1 subunit epsilon [Acetobacterium fimetarium]|uniref:ATP synthase epsilon chain n=1 Tax=Acetobacterium fimetarium TaxID=52691 RepID=A0ABR6WVK3_9FIRM|nr:ATP synthase F1 subunit epsilon [Acetobacterium fimetarium]MBC3804463.1 ATP synthase F1 subunit epsilon [Acetobacterium fimetarium]
MASTFKLKIISPTGVFYEGETERIVVRGTEGEFAVLPNHIPFTTTLALGTFNIIMGDGTKKYGTLLGGIATINSDETIILTDAAEWPEDIDIERAREARERALQRLKDSKYDADRAEVALQRAIIRISTKERK